MALEDILRILDEQAESESEAVLAKAREQAEKIELEAREEADRLTAAGMQAAEAAGRDRAGRVLNAARLSAKREMASARERAIEEVLGSVEQRLGDVRAGGDYAKLFERLFSETAAVCGDAGEVRVDVKDQALAGKAIAGAGKGYVLGEPIDTAGGVVIVATGGRISHSNMLEDRLDRVRHEARTAIAKALFS
ncbi:MAG: V-type ATP synthase subunit E [Coriobacteriia bacterium]